MKRILVILLLLSATLLLAIGISAEEAQSDIYEGYTVTATKPDYSFIDDLIAENKLGYLPPFSEQTLAELTEIREGDTFWLNIAVIDRRKEYSDIEVMRLTPRVSTGNIGSDTPFSIDTDKLDNFDHRQNEHFGTAGNSSTQPMTAVPRSIVSIPLIYSGTGNTFRVDFRYINFMGAEVNDSEATFTVTITEAIPTADSDSNSASGSDSTSEPDSNTNSGSTSTSDSNSDSASDSDSNSDESDPDLEPVPPIIMLQSIDYGGTGRVSGEEFTLSITAKNLSTDYPLEDVVVTLDVTDEIYPVVGSTPGNFIDTVPTRGTLTSSFKLMVKPNVSPETVMIKVSYDAYFRDIDDKLDDVSYTYEIAVPIVELERFSISELDYNSTPYTEDNEKIVVVLLNKGAHPVSNISVRLTSDLSDSNDYVWVGELGDGTEERVEFDITSDEVGEVSGVITVKYEDSSMKEYILSDRFYMTFVDEPVVRNTQSVESSDDDVEVHAETRISSNQTPVGDAPTSGNDELLLLIGIAVFASAITLGGTIVIQNIKNNRKSAPKH